MNQQVLQGHWEEVSGRLREKWGELTNDDVQQFDGNVEQLVGKIHRKTGASKEVIEHYLEDLADECSSDFERARATATQYAAGAGEIVQDAYGNTIHTMQRRYSDAEKAVRHHPAESVVTAFGVGLVAGVVVGMLIRR